MKNNHVLGAYSSCYGFRITSIQSNKISKVLFGDWHYDESLVLAYFKKASGEVRIEGNTYRVSDGDMIILNYNEVHSVKLKEQYGERISLYLNKNMFDRFPRDTKKLLSPFCDRKPGTRNYLSATDASDLKIDCLLEEAVSAMAESNEVSELIAFTAIIRILNALCKKSCAGTEDNDKHFSNPIVKEAIQYVNVNYLTNISLDLVAHEIGISKYHLSRLFKDTVGISLWDYIVSKRLFHFNELIKNGASIQSAAFDSGFNNYSNFYRLYKKHMNISPLEYKNKMRRYLENEY